MYTSLRFHPLHLNPIYGSRDRLPNCEWLNEHALNIPLHHRLTEAEVDQVLDGLKQFRETQDVTGGRSGAVTIAGAGCAGLAAAIALQRRGYQVTILECADRIGGLAGGVLINGNIYEYGPHIFHTTDPEVLADVERIAGHVLIPFKKTIKIKFLGQYFAFPLAVRDVIVKLPAPTVAHAALSFVWHFAKGALEGEAGMVNSEKVLQRYYGNVLYEIFFKDYIAKVWGIEPAGLSPSFAKQRVPRLDPLDALGRLTRKFLPQRRRAVQTDSYVERVEGVNYTTKTGFHAIVEVYAGSSPETAARSSSTRR